MGATEGLFTLAVGRVREECYLNSETESRPHPLNLQFIGGLLGGQRLFKAGENHFYPSKRQIHDLKVRSQDGATIK